MEKNEKCFEFLKVPEAPMKPRKIHWTVVSDWGFPLKWQEDVLETCADIVDRAKFTDHTGLVSRFDANFIVSKNRIYKKKGIPVYTGGIPFEIAYLQNKVEPFFTRLVELEFSGVEISDDTIPTIPPEKRIQIIKAAKKEGLEVFTEIGKKFPDAPLVVKEAVDSIKRDIDAGSESVAIENSDLQLLRKKDPKRIIDLARLAGLENIVFEIGPAGWPEIAVWLLKEIGPDINAENLSYDRVFALEGMRRGISRTNEYPFLREKKGKL